MWSAPLPILRLVAVLLLACAVTAFTLGLLGAEPRGGRLPGEAATGETGATVVATEAQPLQEGAAAAPPAEPEEETVETAEAATAPAPEASTEAQVPALQIPDVPPPAPAPPPQKAAAPAQPAPRGDAIGDLVDGLTPAEEPPF